MSNNNRKITFLEFTKAFCLLIPTVISIICLVCVGMITFIRSQFPNNFAYRLQLIEATNGSLLAIIGIAITVWVGLNIYNLVEKREIEILTKSVDDYRQIIESLSKDVESRSEEINSIWIDIKYLTLKEDTIYTKERKDIYTSIIKLFQNHPRIKDDYFQAKVYSEYANLLLKDFFIYRENKYNIVLNESEIPLLNDILDLLYEAELKLKNSSYNKLNLLENIYKDLSLTFILLDNIDEGMKYYHKVNSFYNDSDYLPKLITILDNLNSTKAFDSIIEINDKSYQLSTPNFAGWFQFYLHELIQLRNINNKSHYKKLLNKSYIEISDNKYV